MSRMGRNPDPSTRGRRWHVAIPPEGDLRARVDAAAREDRRMLSDELIVLLELGLAVRRRNLERQRELAEAQFPETEPWVEELLARTA